MIEGVSTPIMAHTKLPRLVLAGHPGADGGRL